MRWIAWFQKQSPMGSAPESEARRIRLAGVQRQLSQRLEGVMRQTEKQLLSTVARIRRTDGSEAEERELEREQQVLERWLDRCEIMQTATPELLREWRDWLRAIRQGVATDLERAELIRSELRVRGVIHEEEVESVSSVHQMRPGEGGVKMDVFEEWDQYLGEKLPLTAQFWQTRVEDGGGRGIVSPAMMHAQVKRMRDAHGQAKIWKRMQQGMG